MDTAVQDAKGGVFGAGTPSTRHRSMKWDCAPARSFWSWAGPPGPHYRLLDSLASWTPLDEGLPEVEDLPLQQRDDL